MSFKTQFVSLVRALRECVTWYMWVSQCLWLWLCARCSIQNVPHRFYESTQQWQHERSNKKLISDLLIFPFFLSYISFVLRFTLCAYCFWCVIGNCIHIHIPTTQRAWSLTHGDCCLILGTIVRCKCALSEYINAICVLLSFEVFTHIDHRRETRDYYCYSSHKHTLSHRLTLAATSTTSVCSLFCI